MRKRVRGRKRGHPGRPVRVLQCTSCQSPQNLYHLWPCAGMLLCRTCVMIWIGAASGCRPGDDQAGEPGRVS